MSRLHRRLIITCLLSVALIFSIYISETKFAEYSKFEPKLSSSNRVNKFITTTINSTVRNIDDNSQILTCEKVWNDVLALRDKQNVTQLNSSGFVINEYLDIVTENKNICDLKNNTSGVQRLLLVLVSSKRTNFDGRKVIRETWGSIREYKGGWQVKTVFLLGQSDYCLKGDKDVENKLVHNAKWKEAVKEDQKILEENEKYEDMIIGSFTDSYRNNTYRHLMGYKFVVERCPQAEFIVKTDDDVFVNIPKILDKRSEEIRNGNNGTYDMYCKTIKNRKPARCKNCERRKWFVTKEEWVDDKFPTFCLGAFFGISREWVERLYAVKNMGGFFWIDDPFISGKLREIAEREFGVKAKWVDISNGVWWEVDKKNCKNVKKSNIQLKQKIIPMFAHLKRNKKFGKLFKCLNDIAIGKNLPFSLNV